MSKSNSEYVKLAYKRASFDHIEDDGKAVYEVYRLADGRTLRKDFHVKPSYYQDIMRSLKTKQDKSLSTEENMKNKLEQGIITQETYDNWYQRYTSYPPKDVITNPEKNILEPVKELSKK